MRQNKIEQPVNGKDEIEEYSLALEILKEVQKELSRVNTGLAERISFLQTEQDRLNELTKNGLDGSSDYIKKLPEILKGIEDDIARLRFAKAALENGEVALLKRHAAITEYLNNFQGKYEN